MLNYNCDKGNGSDLDQVGNGGWWEEGQFFPEEV